MKRFVSVAVALAFASLVVSTAAEKRTLFEHTSPYNTIVVTENESGLRTLWFEKGDARQSVVKVGDPDHLELAYARAMPVGLAFVERPRRVLIVGLGGGTIPSFLRAHFPHLVIDVVDIDPDVVYAAKEFFGFREDAAMRVYVEDGRRFIEKRRNLYDIIFLDAFGSENIPYHLATREFLQSVRKALTPEGLAVGNIWSRGSNPLHDSMVRTYQETFDELYIIDVQGTGNEILIALPRKHRISQDDVVRRAQAISKQNHFRFDMGEYVRYGFRHAGKEDAHGRILTDRDKATSH